MKKSTVRLNESQLKRIVMESVRKVMREGFVDDGDIMTQIEDEGGMSYTNEDMGIYLHIEKYERPNDGSILYLVIDDTKKELLASSKYLQKAQRSLYNAAVKAIEEQNMDNEPVDDEF